MAYSVKGRELNRLLRPMHRECLQRSFARGRIFEQPNSLEYGVLRQR
jgi:hypothetical protein